VFLMTFGTGDTIKMFYFNTFTGHLLLFCTMANKCTIISQIITLLYVSTLSYLPQAACNQCLAKLHKYFMCKLLVIQFTIKMLHIGFFAISYIIGQF